MCNCFNLLIRGRKYNSDMIMNKQHQIWFLGLDHRLMCCLLQEKSGKLYTEICKFCLRDIKASGCGV